MIWLLTTVQQALLFAATILFVGCVSWRVVVAPGASVSAVDVGAELSAMAQTVLHWTRRTALALIVAWGLRMVVQVMAFRDPFAPLWDDVSLLLFQTAWGTVWMVQGVVIMSITMTLWLGLRPSAEVERGASSLRVGAPWWVLTLLSFALVTTLATSGHAMGVDSWRTAALAADALHTLAAGSWIGTLAVILMGARSSRGEGQSPATFGAQIQRFSPMALAAGGTLVMMGIGLSWTHLTDVSDLWTTGYGRVLFGKIGIVLAILGLGFWNWRQGVPVSDRAEGVRIIRRRGAWEVGLAAGVIVLTAILVHSTKP